MIYEFFFFVMGLVFGSFATMASHRLVHGGSFLTRSNCPKCKRKLSVLNLFPLISFIIQSGRCSYCKEKISYRYPAIEICTGFAFYIIALLYWHQPFLAFLMCGIALSLIIIIVTDFESYIIPDEIQISLFVLGLIYAVYFGFSWQQIVFMPLICLCIALLLKYGFLFFTKRDGLGFGDVKFFFVAGLYLTPDQLSAFFLISGIIGMMTAFLWKVLKKGDIFPFGPSLALSLMGIILFPQLAKISNYIIS